MSNIDQIAVFNQVARLGSFSQAAKYLGIPVSTVSRRVSELETRLGLMLIQRTTRKLSLTRAGERYFQQCSDLLLGLQEAESEITQLQQSPKGLLKIAIPPGMGHGRFISFLSDFMNKYPEINIDLAISNDYVDLIKDGIDVAIRFGKLTDSRLFARRLGSADRWLGASPKYIKKYGAPKTPQELEGRSCLAFKIGTDGFKWILSNGKKKIKVSISGKASASDLNTVTELAIKGHGIALLPQIHCFDPLEKGLLVRVLPEWASMPVPVHAVFLNRKFLPAKLECFLNELSVWESPNWSKQ